MLVDNHHIDDDNDEGVGVTEPGVKASNAMRGSNIPKPLLRDVWNKDDWKGKLKQNKKNRNTSVGGHHTCGSRSFNSTRKYLEIKHARPISSTEFFTHTHAMKRTKLLDQLPTVSRSGGSNRSVGANGSVGTNGSAGVNESAGENGSSGENGSAGANGSVESKASTSTRVGESNEVGESSGGQAVEPRWVNDKSRDHMEKNQKGMVESHGENVESHPHNEELWNKVTPPNRGNTFEAYNASDPIFFLTETPSTRNANTSQPQYEKVEVLEKSLKDLEQAREEDKELFDEAIEQQRKHSEEKLETFKGEMKKETNERLAEALA